MIRKKATMHIRYVLSRRIGTNGLIKLSENHSSKLMVDRQKLTTRRHKIDPSKPRIIINKYDIVMVAPFRSKGSTPPYIRVNEIKRTL